MDQETIQLAETEMAEYYEFLTKDELAEQIDSLKEIATDFEKTPEWGVDEHVEFLREVIRRCENRFEGME